MNINRYMVLITTVLVLTMSTNVFAHCDSMDGPIIKDAQRALAKNDVTPVLKWVSTKDEASIEKIFKLITSVRGQSQNIEKIADNYFFETLVRIHRTGEGEGFSGLKPKGSVEPAIAATDLALAKGNIHQLAGEIASSVKDGIEKRFKDAHSKMLVAEDSIVQGREYVEAYVELTHFIESIHNTVSYGASHKHLENQ